MIDIRHDWQTQEVSALFDLPFFDLVFMAHQIHRECFEPNTIQISSLLSIKTGGCPENCAYCPQSAHYKTGVEKQKLMDIEEIVKHAQLAKDNGASRFCMGAAWRSPRDEDIEQVSEMVKAVKALGLETCVTLGMLKPHQAQTLKQEGLDFYNHNIDTSPEFYEKVITTRTFQDRLDTLENVRQAGIKICCGGILGMGETRQDRIRMLQTLANLPEHPGSVPINKLIPIPGTPLAKETAVDPLEFVRTIAVARIIMPKAYVRLSAGREGMSDELQTLCFFAGANSMFFGEKLLTAKNPDLDHDKQLLDKLGLMPC